MSENVRAPTDIATQRKIAEMLKQYGKPAEPKREVLRLTKREQELNAEKEKQP